MRTPAAPGTGETTAREQINTVSSYIDEIARRVVGAELQFITYTEFLPALGVALAPYRGYNPRVGAGLANEFAAVGYRADSMIHGTIDVRAGMDTYTAAQLDAMRAQGIEIEPDGDELEIDIPLNVAFGNPDLVREVGLDPILAGLGSERQYRNDEQIDNQLRSVLFQVPGPDVDDPSECLDGTDLPSCFTGVLDLGAVDIQRARDHGIPTYNDLRRAYGLEPRADFAAVTGEASEEFPADPDVDAANPLDDPSILDFTALLDADGNPIEATSEDAETEVVTGVRRTPVAARLKGLYGDVDRLDAFVGMLAEPHLPGSDLGELQRAIWKRQFEALRDGDRFFYANDAALRRIRRLFGITYRHTLAEVIAMNTDLEPGELRANVFKVE